VTSPEFAAAHCPLKIEAELIELWVCLRKTVIKFRPVLQFGFVI
jgi:hypothetical protein